MNYYEHHIRDYDAATSHLSWDEDMAYSRLLRWYYRKERPIPADLPEACRQVRAHTKAQRDAVESVLREFFRLEADGWHKDTCDEAIARYLDGEPEREAKKKNEDTRLARHRAERAELFGVINAAGQHLPYNAPIAAVRELADKIRNAPATGAATQPATPATAPATPATATQSPDTNHQSPTRRVKGSRASALPVPPPDDVDAGVWTDWLALRKAKKAPVTVTVVSSARSEAAEAGMTLEAFLRVWCVRGSQGLQAGWLKPHERGAATNGQRSFREIDEANAAADAARWSGGLAARKPTRVEPLADVEVVHGTAVKRLG